MKIFIISNVLTKYKNKKRGLSVTVDGSQNKLSDNIIY